MQLITSIVRPQKVEAVKDALAAMGVSGITLTGARGHGQQKGHRTIYRGRESQVTSVPKILIECVVPDHLVTAAVQTVIEAAKTGEIGDGRIFVTPVLESYRIRTGERE